MAIVEIAEPGNFVDTSDCYDTPAELAGVLSYKQNNASVKEACPSCGQVFKPVTGVWPFLTKTGQPVCEECANRIEEEFRKAGIDTLAPAVAHLAVTGMSVLDFQKCAAVLLKNHYGLCLNDTHLNDESIVQECINQGWRPFQVIAEHADEADLDRIDKEGFYGVPSKAAITAEDEDAALMELQ
jgi:Protein of unknown function (DUF1219).